MRNPIESFRKVYEDGIRLRERVKVSVQVVRKFKKLGVAGITLAKTMLVLEKKSYYRLGDS